MRRLNVLLWSLLAAVFVLGPVSAKEDSVRAAIGGQLLAGGVPASMKIEVRARVEDEQRPAAGPALHVTKSGDDGNFQISNASPGRYELRALAPNGMWYLTWVRVPDARGIVPVTFDVLSGAQSLSGRAHWSDGRAFHGWVYLAQDDAVLGVAATDETGRFEASSLPEGRLGIWAHDRTGTFSRFIRLIDVPLDGACNFVVDAWSNVEIQQTEGRVLDMQGDPIQGATVSTKLRSAFAHTVKTNAEGRFAITMHPDVLILGSARGYATSLQRWTEFHSSGRVIRLRTLRPLRGTVIGPDGPVANVPVLAIPHRRHHSYELATWIRSDKHGGFRFDQLPPEVVTVFALGGGWVTKRLTKALQDERHRIEFDLSGAPLSPVSIEVERCARVFGTLTGMGSAPVEIDFRPRMALHLPPGVRERFRTYADKDGRWNLDIIPNVRYSEFVATTSDRERVESYVPIMGPGGTFVSELEFDTPRALTARFRDAVSKESIVGARVFLSGAGRNGRGDARVTDADGSVRFESTPKGPSSLLIFSARYSQVWDLPAGNESKDVTFDAVRATKIEAIVRGPAAMANRRIDVTIHKEENGTSNRPGFDLEARVGQSFRIRPMQAYAIRIEASTRWEGHHWRAEAAGHTGEDQIVLTLRKGEPIAPPHFIDMLDADGQPVGFADVSFLREDNDRVREVKRTHARDGRLPVPAVDAESGLWIAVWSANSASTRHGAALNGPFKSPPNEIRLPRPSRLRGRVETKDGKGVAGVRVQAEPWLRVGETRYSGPLHVAQETRSREDGTYEIVGLGAATYRVTWIAPNPFASIPPQYIEDVGGEALRTIVTPVGSIKLHVVDSDGAPVGNADVKLEASGSDTEQGTTDYKGVYVAGHLDLTGRYKLTVTPPSDEATSLGTFEIQAWRPSDRQVVLRVLHDLYGTVVDKTGRPIANIQVGMTDAETKSSTTQVAYSDEDGDFEFLGLQGVVQVGVQCAIGKDRSGWKRVDMNTEHQSVEFAVAENEMIVIPWPRSETTYFSPNVRVVDAEKGTQIAHVQGMAYGGRVFIRGLRPDARVHVLAGPTDDGQVGVVRDVQASASVLDITWTPGLRIRGTVRAPLMKTVWATWNGFQVQAPIEDDGTFVLEGLPPDTTWVVRALSGRSDVQVTVPSGSEDVVLGE